MTVAVGSKTPLILQIPQLAHRLIFFFPSTRPICFPAFLFFVGIHLTITLFLFALLFYSAFVSTDPLLVKEDSNGCEYLWSPNL
ncbi:hypothetical protein ACN42_g5326 [Penicillium freii]|uniref:Uncharacterized protein n=1 Tax=Penicillium freii TaxID=48697 RepID=A0A101MJM4_PENFR|nr:hypothetical protein ACN42_g5326 [Penicillium freii]